MRSLNFAYEVARHVAQLGGGEVAVQILEAHFLI